MHYETYICIDDTDEIDYIKSTGLFAENIVEFIENNFSKCSFISRHQLLLDERINYTSHNSSMCFSACLNKNEKNEVVKFIQKLLIKESAATSEPGIAIAVKNDIVNLDEFIEFGKKAKILYITKNWAYEEAARQNIYLEEIKNKGRGVIGALAGLALRLSGDDGRIKGKIKLKQERISVGELLNLGVLDEVLDENFIQIPKNEIIKVKSNLKLVIKNFRAVLLVKKDENGEYRAYEIEELRQF